MDHTLSVKTVKFTFLKNLYEYGNINQPVLAFQAPNHYRCQINYVLRVPTDLIMFYSCLLTSVNIVKQLYYSRELQSKTDNSEFCD